MPQQLFAQACAALWRAQTQAKAKAQGQEKAKGQVQEKVKAQGQSHAATLRLQGKSAVSGGNFNHDWHAATLRLPGKSGVSGGYFNHDWHAASLRLQGEPAVSGGNFNNDWHAATLRLQGKSAPCKSSPTPPKAVSSGLLLAKNKCETDFLNEHIRILLLSERPPRLALG